MSQPASVRWHEKERSMRRAFCVLLVRCTLCYLSPRTRTFVEMSAPAQQRRVVLTSQTFEKTRGIFSPVPRSLRGSSSSSSSSFHGVTTTTNGKGPPRTSTYPGPPKQESRQDALYREMSELTKRGPRAFELYPTLPPTDVDDWEPRQRSSSSSQSSVDPFALMDLSSFADEVKSTLTIGEETLYNASKLYFDEIGKRVRPTIIGLLAKCLPASDPSKQATLGQITEMIHVASLIHDDLLDDADVRRGGDAVHVRYSNKVAVFAGDYLLARASVLLARLGDIRVVNTMASALDSLVSGEVMQIKVTRAAAKKQADDGDETDQLYRRLPGDDGTFLGRLKAAQALFSKEIVDAGGSIVPGVLEASRKIVQALSLTTAAAASSTTTGFQGGHHHHHHHSGRTKKIRTTTREDDRREFELYLQKSYFKTASLISDACKSTALLAEAHDSVAQACEEFGFHLGLAFQIVDDVLDFAVDSTQLGKPAGADLSLGLATAPILYATRQYPELRPLIDRRFKGPGDVTAAYDMVRQSDGIRLARKLAHFHVERAVDALKRATSPSLEQDALIKLADIVLTRSK